MRFVKLLAAALAAGMLAVLSGCSSLGGAGGSATAYAASKSPEQRVVERAQQRWDALVRRDFDKAYALVSPSGRTTLPLEIFRNRISNAAWRSAQAKSARCEGEICDVVIQIEFEVLPGRFHSQPIEEKWILESGEWWLVYRG